MRKRKKRQREAKDETIKKQNGYRRNKRNTKNRM